MNIQREIDKAMIILPPFESYFMDRVQVPIIEPSMINISDAYLPSSEELKIRVLTFRKNFVSRKWEFESKNFD
jgi:glycyl-tRNA synthetase alpha subunit